VIDGYEIVEEISKKLLIWRLKALSSLNDDGSAVLKLVHEETLPSPSPFVPRECFVSEKYIVTCLMRPSQNDIEEPKLFIEVRSTVNFGVVYCSPEECLTSAISFSFEKDVFAIQMVCCCQLELRNYIRYN